MEKTKNSHILWLNDDNLRYLTIAAITAMLFVWFSIVSAGFFSLNTVMNILRQAASTALAAIAMTMVMLTGGIDLSVGSVIAFSGAAGALVMQEMGQTAPFPAGVAGFAVTIGAAVAFGMLNGISIGYLKMAPFIVTLATMSLARGLTLTLTASSRVMIHNSWYNFAGQVELPGGIPASTILVAAAYVAAFLLLHHMTFGRRTYAVGDNADAAKASGIRVERHILLVYVVAGVFVGLATIVIAGRARSAQPMAAVGMEFDVITAVVIGGTSLMGGQGNLKGTLLGVCLTSVIFTGLSMLDVSTYVNYMVKGSLVLLAVLSNRMISGGMERHAVRNMAKKSGRMAAARTPEKFAALADGPQLLELKDIVKAFPGVRALDGVSLKIRRGTVHALCGENGAGKSTLMKILSGIYQMDEGEILIDGRPVEIRSPADAEHLGIAVIHQELANIPELSVSQNVNLGKELMRGGWMLDVKAMHERTCRLLERFGLQLDVGRKMETLTVGQQQMIECVKAFGTDAWVVIMDEPTSAITEADKNYLFQIIQELKENGVAVVYISHRMSEIFEIADEITVLRDGRQVVSGKTGEFDEDAVIRHMVGRQLNDIFTRKRCPCGKEVLRVENLYRKGAFEPISFSVHSGEVLGFSGLMGAGRTEIMRCLAGLDKPDGGVICLDGEKLQIRCVMDAVRAGVVMVSEDRRREGIIPHLSVRENTTLAALPWISRMGWIDKKQDNIITKEYMEVLRIKAASPEQKIANLSGGNQQKVCLAKWLNRHPRVIILDEPTRGIDVGAKAEIHKLIDQLVRDGVAVIMISSELPEILGVSDRIMVLHEGHLIREYAAGDGLTQEDIMRSAAGG